MARPRLLQSPRKLLTRPKITLRARKFTIAVPRLPPVAIVPGLNDPESRIYNALRELQLNFSVQRGVLGGDVLGGARMDFLLFDYRIDLEYNGPFHDVTSGRAKDALRNLGIARMGYRVETVFERDLPRLKPRILEIIGRPL